MSSNWDDFSDIKGDKHKECHRAIKGPQRGPVRETDDDKKADQNDTERTGCSWGFDGDLDDVNHDEPESDTNKFIPIYERYLQDKKSVSSKTQNSNLFSNDPQKALLEWFENEGHEFSIETDQVKDNKFVCRLDIPVGEHDFTLTSDIHNKKKDAIDEICSYGCRMLDESQLLYSSLTATTKEDIDRRKRFSEANKEDDIELDHTMKKHCTNLNTSDRLSAGGNATSKNVNTYESLMARWTGVNMSILRAKAELSKLDLSVTKCDKTNPLERLTDAKDKPVSSKPDDDHDDDDEVDPLDEFMSSLEKKTKLSMDDKIEKSRLKSQIASYEREQSELSRLIELAKPTFDLNKVASSCPATSGRRPPTGRDRQ